MNTAVAEALCEACDMLERADNLEEAVHNVTCRNFAEHQRVLFAGNGYSEEWLAEAKRRGLPNLATTVDAIPELVKPETVAMYKKFGVFNENELHARAEMKYENYAKTLNIDARVMIDIAGKHIIPSVIKYTKVLAEDIIALKNAGFTEYSVQSEMLERINRYVKEAYTALKQLVRIGEQANLLETGVRQAEFYRNEVIPAMNALRAPIDRLEILVDKDFWSMPSYGDLLFDV